MKKGFIIFLSFIFIQLSANASSYIDKQIKNVKNNTEFETVKTHTATYNNKNDDYHIKDPKLLELSPIKPVNEKEYKAKLKSDEEIYETIIKKRVLGRTENVNAQPYGTDFYNIYRIAERMLRANNLDYMNWRICIRKTATDFNAYSTDSNLIIINTALYDSFADNDDAMAYIIGHEMAHSVYGDLKQDEKNMKRYDLYSKIISDDGIINFFWKMGILKGLRQHEYMADVEGGIFMTRAGYNMDNAMEVLNFMNTLPVYEYELFKSHPEAQKRIKNMSENKAVFLNTWANEGKYNIMNSSVLPCKKSSDRVSIIISKNPKAKTYFSPENLKTRLLRVAYMQYKHGDMENAIEYFKKYLSVEKNYAVCLYISYANEYLYNQTNSKKYLKEAIKYAKKADSLNNNNKYVYEQLTNLIRL